MKQSALVNLLAALLALAASPRLALAHLGRPLRGSVELSVLLCKYSDSPTPSDGIGFYEDLMINAGTTGLADYWSEVSNGTIDVDGSVVRGWFTIGKTTEEARETEPRIQKHTDCVDQAIAEGYTPPDDHVVVVITSPFIDTFGLTGKVMLGEGLSLSLVGHEAGHGVGMRHSYTDDAEYCNVDWATVGEYGDPWDVMSHAATYQRGDVGDFRRGGPGLNAYHLDRMGWLSLSKILRFGADGVYDKTVTLHAPTASSPSAGSFQMVRIPFYPQDLQRYYTVEYRVDESWDSGFPSDNVLIHEVAKRDFERCSDGSTVNGQYRSYVKSDKPSNTPFEDIDENGVRVDVVSKDPSSGTAVVRIRSTKPELCVLGFVWREARPSDHVCVTPARRSEVAAENAAADENREPGGGDFGPNTCKQGFVWREAFPEDFVCVVPDSRTQARVENEQAYFKRIGFAAYGPLTCKQGFVWREADEQDWVCVSGERRSDVRDENELGPSRREPGGGAFGPDTCKQGFVWREAFPGDHVCVLPESRSLAASENEERTNNLSKDENNNAAASEGECVDVDCDWAETEIPAIPPEATDDEASTTKNTPVTVDVADNDQAFNGILNPLSARIKSGPSNGEVSNNNDGSFLYTPDQDYEGEDSFVYEICDAEWLCSRATVAISITNDDSPTDSPAESPTSAPVDDSPTDPPVEGTTIAPVDDSPTDSPVESPTSAPVDDSPTDSPVESPTSAPVGDCCTGVFFLFAPLCWLFSSLFNLCLF